MYAVGLAWKDAYRLHRVIPLAMDVLAASKACCSSARAGRLSLGVRVVGSFASMRLATLAERPIEVEGGAYECQVREGLGEVAQRLAAGSDLLGVEPEVVGVAEHLLEEARLIVEPARPRQGLDEPERA